MTILNQDTLVPLGLVISAVASLIGVIIWLTRRYVDVKNLKAKVDRLEGRVEKELEENKTDSQRLIKLETQVQFIIDKVNSFEQIMRDMLNELRKK